VDWKSYASIINACFGAVVLIIVSSTSGTINEIKQELFHHLTNSDMHTPRSVIEDQMKTKASSEQFTIYQTMRDRQFSDLRESLSRLEDKIDDMSKKRR